MMVWWLRMGPRLRGEDKRANGEDKEGSGRKQKGGVGITRV